MKKEITVVGNPKLPKKLQERLMAKIIDKNDDKIIELMQQRNSHVVAIQRIDKEILELTTITGLE